MECPDCGAFLTVVRSGDPERGATTGRVDCACGWRSVWLEGNMKKSTMEAAKPKPVPKPKPALTLEEIKAKTKPKKSAPTHRRRAL